MRHIGEIKMQVGKQRRLSKIFAADRRCLIVAMDHAAYMVDTVRGLEEPEKIFKSIKSAGADALMTTLGTIRKSAQALQPFPLIMSVESFPEYIHEAVEQALCLNVEMLKCMVYPWSEKAPDSLHHFERLATVADRWSLPIMAEVFPGGYQAGPEWQTVNRLAACARMAAEAGADVIKTFFLDEVESYKDVIRNSPVPIVVLGGEKSDNPMLLLEKICRAMDAGASGVAIGRNIWGHPDPGAMVAAICGIIHQGSSVDHALKILV